ncbi:hypothetical protein EV673_3027 [Limnobacter thiooxidans]|jgi:hypothetical protein|uniref:Uncharacterized protein n=1 Tax=Limnobacter thiooxidans TaxID=131080 RepID=A0AA86M808_9BURK|nr:hypothetical protein [Limnobacter sp.]MCZ8016917.1 hypothetical protein [Limnobacter sp.]RZS38637.1 hypothetical protein EV673_3027 [Limnobacter thiooxidans]BET24914.1 hypothetical protein RGQ30_04150 [Limnobacter thiooxidans]
MDQPPSPRENNDRLMPQWGKVALVVVALLVMLGYASPDMRAVYVAAWAACF